jgi:hypothetical protein
MKIFLDDIRTVKMSHNKEKGLGIIEDFIIIRDGIDFTKTIEDKIKEIKLISYDHDLACFLDGVEFTGKDALDFVIQKCLEYNIELPDWYVHSDNTSGRENIIKLALNYMKNVDDKDISGFRYFHRGYYNGKFV